MRRSSPLAIALILAAGSSAVSACGLITGLSDYEVGGADVLEASATSSSGSTSSSGGSSGDGAPSGDASSDGSVNDAPSDAPTDQQAPGDGAADAAKDAGDSGIPATDPGSIRCNATTCNASTQRCCYLNAHDAQCLAKLSTTCNVTELNCDEDSDCAGSEVCCLQKDNANPTWSTVCTTSANCNAGDGKHAHVCKSSSGCGIFAACKPIVCGDRALGTCNGETIAQCN